jgi:hypothetical protein
MATTLTENKQKKVSFLFLFLLYLLKAPHDITTLLPHPRPLCDHMNCPCSSDTPYSPLALPWAPTVYPGLPKLNTRLRAVLGEGVDTQGPLDILGGANKSIYSFYLHFMLKMS